MSTRVIPGFFSAKPSSSVTICAACAAPSVDSVVMRFTIEKSVDSMNSISPSNICALLAKWRYSAASETSRRASSPAVVIFSPRGDSSIVASVCSICNRRSPGLLAIPFSPFCGPYLANAAHAPTATGASACLDHRADALVGQHVQQQCFFDPPIDDMRALDAVPDGIERRTDLGEHPAVDGAIGEQRVDLGGGQSGQQLAVLVEHADGIGHQHQLLGVKSLSKFPSTQVGVDVVSLAFLADPDGRDHRNEVARIEQVDQLRVYLLDLADESDVDEFGLVALAFQQHLARVDERAVLAGEAHCAAAMLVDQADDFLIELA